MEIGIINQYDNTSHQPPNPAGVPAGVTVSLVEVVASLAGEGGRMGRGVPSSITVACCEDTGAGGEGWEGASSRILVGGFELEGAPAWILTMPAGAMVSFRPGGSFNSWKTHVQLQAHNKDHLSIH